MSVNMVYTPHQTWCKHVLKHVVNMSLNVQIFKHCVNMRGIVKKSQVELSVREGGREGGYLWGIEVLRHLKSYNYRGLPHNINWNRKCLLVN